MAPEYEKVRELYNGPSPKRTDILITRVQGNANEQICQDFGVYSYPTILLFKKGEKKVASIFQGPQRIMEVMSSWIEKNAGEPEKDVAEERRKKEEEERKREEERKEMDEEGKKEEGKKREEEERNREEEERKKKEEEEEGRNTKEENRKEEELGRRMGEEEGRRTYELLVTLAEEMKLLNKTVVAGFVELKERREEPAPLIKPTVHGLFPIIIAFTVGVTFGMLLIILKNTLKRKVGSGPDHHLDFKAV